MNKNIEWNLSNVFLETKEDEKVINIILDENFGKARYLRTINIMRANVLPNKNYSIVYKNDKHELLGLVRIYFCVLENKVICPFIGPVTVVKKNQSQGLGKFLLETAINNLEESNIKNEKKIFPFIFLVGRLTYYKKFGFTNNGTDKFILDGPLSPNELLIRWNKNYINNINNKNIELKNKKTDQNNKNFNKWEGKITFINYNI